MTKRQVVAYYKKWTGGNISNDNAIAFTDMLLKKATFALRTGQKIYAYDKTHTGKELEQMYCLAEDIFCEYPELRYPEVKA